MAFVNPIRFQVRGLEALLRKLQETRRSVRGVILRRAVTKAVQPVNRDAKRRARVLSYARDLTTATGGARLAATTYAKSIGYRVKTYSQKGLVIGIAGPRRGPQYRKTTGWKRTRGRYAGRQLVEWPTKISHVLERGTRRSQAFPALEPAFQGNVGLMQQIMAQESWAGIQRAVARGKW